MFVKSLVILAFIFLGNLLADDGLSNSTSSDDGGANIAPDVNSADENAEVIEEAIEESGDDDGMPYRVGVGISDMTGPCVEITFFGYAELGQTGRGIHTRQYARAFIFEKDGSRVVLVTAEVQSVGIAVRRQVVKNLQELYGDTYTLRNVILTGIHTHSTPGGYMVDFLLDVSILGFSEETYNAYVDGITRVRIGWWGCLVNGCMQCSSLEANTRQINLQSIVRAHENMVGARLYIGQTMVSNIHKNRSPYSYENNPPEEKARYELNVDDILTQVRIVKSDGNLHGVLNWYAVHPTSMNMTNQLISADNIGYAARRLEKALNPFNVTGKPDIVAGFFASNLGDVSPNIREARCEFSGKVCDNQYLLCDTSERCYAQGPGDDMFESTRIIGEAVYKGALEVLNTQGEELTGKIAVVHQFVDMPKESVPKYDPVLRTFNTSDQVSGCIAALGYSFAAGTTDGANMLNISQGTLKGNPLFQAIGGVLAPPAPGDAECHAPKPILLATGRTNFPLPWHPHRVSTTIIWLADLVIAGVPGEPTTMTGRRIRDVVGEVMEKNGFEPRVVVSGITNEYIHYVTTFEEYQVQRYEGASTIYGPHSLDIFLNKFVEFTTAAIEGIDVPPGAEPEDNKDKTVSIITPVIVDSAGLGKNFGDVVQQPPSNVQRGETVNATFVAANPRNDLKQESYHAVIERLEADNWQVVATDADWETKFYWERQSTILGTSTATFEWTVPADAVLAPHRIVYYGAAKSLFGAITQFNGTSDSFDVVA